MGEDNGEKGGRVFRNNYKGHMAKPTEGWKQGKEVGMAGGWEQWWGAVVNADNCT